jgi:uncharacterized cupredoxin-like copper-binding protein
VALLIAALCALVFMGCVSAGAAQRMRLAEQAKTTACEERLSTVMREVDNRKQAERDQAERKRQPTVEESIQWQPQPKQ